jgi:hypothetical protein
MYKITIEELKEITELLDKISKQKLDVYSFKPFEEIMKLQKKAEVLSGKVKQNFYLK